MPAKKTATKATKATKAKNSKSTKNAKSTKSTKTVKAAPEETVVVEQKVEEPVEETPVAETPIEETPVETIIAKGKARKSRKTTKTAKTVKAVKVETDTATTVTGGSRTARYFKVVVDGSEAHGRFSGTKPKQAASKALSSILKERDNKEGKIKFSIIECTRGSKHKQYNYIGERIELDNPMEVVIGKGTEKEKSITYKYNNRVMKDLPKNH